MLFEIKTDSLRDGNALILMKYELYIVIGL
ncbi:hypothetical protein AF72_01775 [Xylella taiwanensis]|uniref:Uncharacterized protein n=1 Tax=Xylella taiwanensis TaxID=1444770 RepID=Z9JND1_9GAMM|nr:hypothetical protein AF72_01775 [Xylella taiwanensis]